MSIQGKTFHANFAIFPVLSFLGIAFFSLGKQSAHSSEGTANKRLALGLDVSLKFLVNKATDIKGKALIDTVECRLRANPLPSGCIALPDIYNDAGGYAAANL